MGFRLEPFKASASATAFLCGHRHPHPAVQPGHQCIQTAEGGWSAVAKPLTDLKCSGWILSFELSLVGLGETVLPKLKEHPNYEWEEYGFYSYGMITVGAGGWVASCFPFHYWYTTPG